MLRQQSPERDYAYVVWISGGYELSHNSIRQLYYLDSLGVASGPPIFFPPRNSRSMAIAV
jgi:hypothetical protein